MNDLAIQAMIEVENTHPWYRTRLVFIQKVLTDKNPNVTSILDFGCGAGGALAYCKQLGFNQILGMDTSEVCLNATSNRGVPAQKIENSIPMLKKESYDIIFVLDVLEHLEDDLSYLIALKNSLRNGGRLLVTVPAHQFLWSYHDKANNHFRRYSKSQFKDLVGKAELKIVRLRWWNSILLPYFYIYRKVVPHKNTLPGNEYQLPPRFLLRPIFHLLNFEARTQIFARVPGLTLVAELANNSKEIF